MHAFLCGWVYVCMWTLVCVFISNMWSSEETSGVFSQVLSVLYLTQDIALIWIFIKEARLACPWFPVNHLSFPSISLPLELQPCTTTSGFLCGLCGSERRFSHLWDKCLTSGHLLIIPAAINTKILDTGYHRTTESERGRGNWALRLLLETFPLASHALYWLKVTSLITEAWDYDWL